MKGLRLVMVILVSLGVPAAIGCRGDREAPGRGSSESGPQPIENRSLPILVPDLMIGAEDGEEHLMFGSISRIDLDARGNIYILDYRNRAVRIFDENGGYLRSVLVPDGQGPQEATNLSGIAVAPDGTLFVNDMRKIIVYGPDGVYARTFLVDFMITSIGCPGSENLVAIGSHDGRILHVFDREGRLLESFGDPFAVPSELEAFKEMPLFQAPIVFSCAKDGRIYVLNPHRYEISVFKDRRLETVLEGKSDLFRPTEQKGRAFVSTAADVVRSGDCLLSVLSDPMPRPRRADVFRNGRQIGTMDMPGRPFCADSRGRIYVAETEGFPRVVRYAVKAE